MTRVGVNWGMRMLARDWRTGELRLLALALVIAVASITAVGGFSDRVDTAFARQAGQSMGGDLVIHSNREIPQELQALARQHQLETARTLTFPSVVRRGDEMVLATIQAVDADYPLRGELRVALQAYTHGEARKQGPAPGTVWLDGRLASLLQAGIGDHLALGATRLEHTRVLISQPDGGASFFAVAPRLLMHHEDLAATGLIRPGSRVRHRLLLAGSPDDIRQFRRELEARADPQFRIERFEDSQPELRAAMQRGEQFLHLAALVSVILAGAAIAMAARQYTRRHLDSAAVLRCLGAGRRELGITYLSIIAVTGLAGCALGVLLGYLAQSGLTVIAADMIGAPLPAPGPGAIATGSLTGLALFIGFALPPLLQVSRTSPVRVLRREQAADNWRSGLAALTAIAATIALMLWHTGDMRLTLRVAGGALLATLLMGMSGWLLVLGIDRMRRLTSGSSAWLHGIASLARRRGETALLITGFGLGITVLLLLGLVRNDLLGNWQDSLGEQTPNQFLVNIQAHEREPLATMLTRAGITLPEFYPMVRARWVRHNNRPVRGEDFAEGRTRRMALREFNLSWAETLPDDNRVSTGQWWDRSDHGRPLLSMDEDLARRLGVETGDTLTFEVAGESIDLEVHNLREIRWDSFNPNFFTLVPPGVLEDYPATWITTLHLEPDQQQLPARLIEAFPSLGVIDVQAIIARVRDVVAQISMAVQYVFLFTLLAGVVVLLSAVQATREQRRREVALMRALGASRRSVLIAMGTEFAVLGLVAGSVSVFAAGAAGWLVGRELMDITYIPSAGIIITGLAGATLGVAAAGILAIRPVLSQSPMRVLGGSVGE